MTYVLLRNCPNSGKMYILKVRFYQLTGNKIAAHYVIKANIHKTLYIFKCYSNTKYGICEVNYQQFSYKIYDLDFILLDKPCFWSHSVIIIILKIIIILILIIVIMNMVSGYVGKRYVDVYIGTHFLKQILFYYIKHLK